MFLGYLESKKECVVSVLFDRISNPLEIKALYIPSFVNLPLSHPYTPWNFCDPPLGGYGYFLEQHNTVLS